MSMPARPLRWYLVALVLAVIAPVLAFAVAQAFKAVVNQQQLVESRLRDASRTVAIAVDRELQTTIAALETLSLLAELDEGNLKRFYEVAGRAQAHQPWYSVWLADTKGRQLLSLLRPFGSELPSVAERDYFRRVMESRQATISGLQVGKLSAGYHLAVSLPVVRDNQIKYVLTAGFKPAQLSHILASETAKIGGVTASIVDRDYTVISRTREPEKWIGKRATPQYIEAVTGRSEGISKAVTLEGHAVYTAYTRLPDTGWIIGVGLPASVVEGPLRQAILLTAMLGALFLFASVAGAILLGRRIAGPITALSSAARHLVEDRPVAAPVAARVTEVTALARALETAGVAIREKRDLAERERKALEDADAAKTEFLALLSHELRNPLSAMTSASEILRWADSADAKVGMAVQIIERQTRHMAHMIEDLLDISLITTGRLHLRREPFDMDQVVTRTVRTWQETGRAKGRDIRLRSQTAWVEADAHRMEQILSNLLDNAVKFTSDDGRIDVTVSTEDNWAQVSVSDNGCGLASDLASRIFTPFVQAKQGIDRGRGGMGLGLALVKRLAELQGGSVAVESEGPNRGARFTVRIPAARSNPRHAPERRPGESNGARWCILVVEDNQDARESLCTLLELDGHDVHQASDGRTGVEIATRVQPQVALIDIGLPDIDGYTVARRIRESVNGTIRLIAVTGYGQTEDRRRAFEAGFDSHVTKPVVYEQLRAMLHPRLSSVNNGGRKE